MLFRSAMCLYRLGGRHELDRKVVNVPTARYRTLQDIHGELAASRRDAI